MSEQGWGGIFGSRCREPMPSGLVTNMSITRKSRNGRLSENRRCPACKRGMALVLNPYYGFRYCRWADEGKCSNSESAAFEAHRRPEQGGQP